MSWINLLRACVINAFWILVLALCALGQTTSPFSPPEENLGVYVINSGTGLDTGCTFRSGSPLIIKLTVPATVNHNEINSDGTLKDPAKLINSNLLSAQAIIRFPVFDIDSGASNPGFAPEVDRVSFNGRFKKILEGVNNTWTDDSIVVPISELKFKSRNSPNAVNELRIDIDTANVGVCECWCMAVDWVAIQFEAAAPYVLAHGIAADASTWDDGGSPGVLRALDDKGVLYDRFSLIANGRSATNAILLLLYIQDFLDQIKSKKVHIIAHSKGGLDSQELQALGPPFKILSLSTLSTPHLGSVAGDLSIIQKTEADDKINVGADPNGFAADYINTWTFGQGPQLPGLRDLTTYRATDAIGAGLRGNVRRTFTFGANADLNDSNDIESNESDGLFPFAIVTNYAARRAWLVMRDFTSAPILSIRQVPGRFWGTRTVLTYQTVLASSPQANDIVVTVRSANPAYGIPINNSLNNHGTIKNAANINRILNLTIPIR